MLMSDTDVRNESARAFAFQVPPCLTHFWSQEHLSDTNALMLLMLHKMWPHLHSCIGLGMDWVDVRSPLGKTLCGKFKESQNTLVTRRSCDKSCHSSYDSKAHSKSIFSACNGSVTF